MSESAFDCEGSRKPESCEPDTGAGKMDERREFLKRCGKYAVYTTPVMLSLLFYDKKKALATTDIGSPDGNGNDVR